MARFNRPVFSKQGDSFKGYSAACLHLIKRLKYGLQVGLYCKIIKSSRATSLARQTSHDGRTSKIIRVSVEFALIPTLPQLKFVFLQLVLVPQALASTRHYIGGCGTYYNTQKRNKFSQYTQFQ